MDIQQAKEARFLARRSAFYDMNRTKQALAQSITLRIHEELEIEPTTREIRAPLLRALSASGFRLLRLFPDVVADKINVGRPVTIQLDEEVTPPELVIQLGDMYRNGAGN